MEKSEVSHQQLSFDDLMGEEDNSRLLALIPYTEYSHMSTRKFEFPQRRFFILSVVVHLILAGYAITIAVQKLQKTEVVEVEYISPTTSSLPPAPVSYSQIESPKIEIPEEKSPEPPVKIVKPVAKSQTPKKPVIRPGAVKTAPIKASAASASTKKTPSTFKAEPLATISDIEVPALSEVSTESSKNLSLKEIENDFDRIDDEQNSKLVAVAKDDAKMLDDSMSELDEATQAVAAEKLDADELASERLQNLKSQKAQLKQAAAEAQARDQATANAKTTKGPKGVVAENAGNGSDDEANDSEAKGTSKGLGSESDGLVRKLEDLRQKPGNPRPSYDVADRMNGLQGTIVINAYVTKEGSLTLFRLIQSSGHRNLDRKTLLALKQWKFYPGQEGWVELPFKWDLKGGVQQKPTLLKRR